ncbi:MAG TPA: peroxiredoxin [Bacteroidota bacterium]|nr:peroxiredoxin [Bacteroidota bacterium]
MKAYVSQFPRFLFILPLLALFAGSGSAQDAPKVGDPAPQFTLPAATKDTIEFSGVSLKSALGKSKVILAFFPAAWSGGCTKEMCTMRDDFEGLSSLKATVLGISGDYVFTDREWAKHLGLQFTLLSDHDHAIARAYHTYTPDSGFDIRSIWVIGQDGRILYKDPAYNVQTPDAFNRLKQALASLK